MSTRALAASGVRCDELDAAAKEGRWASSTQIPVAIPPKTAIDEMRLVSPSASASLTRSEPRNQRNASAPSTTSHAPTWIGLLWLTYWLRIFSGASLLLLLT